ncbi:MAG: hypothetical protein JNM17_20215 [Archangium sp.]|nr:hypothetical protein [Archangium sp.]
MLIGCGRSALTDPESPSAGPGAASELQADAGTTTTTLPTTNCRKIGVYAPVGFFAEHESPTFVDAEFTSTAGWTSMTGSGVGDTMWAAVTWARAGIDTGVMVPGTFDLSVATYGDCVACVIFCELNANDRCSHRYLARAGTMTVTEATRGPRGTFAATLRDVVFREWDLDGNSPIAGGKQCVTVESAELRGRF